MQLLPLLTTFLLAWSAVKAAQKLQNVYQWKQADFVFPSAESRNIMVKRGIFVPGNPIILDVDKWQKDGRDRVWVTLPRFNRGTPATLATVTEQMDSNGSPLLRPYPDWSWHREGECDGLTSVFRVNVDSCGRLWVIDTGRVDILTDSRLICPPQIVVFDLNSDKIIWRHRFDSAILKDDSLLITIAVDVRDDCRNSFAYVADVTGYQLLVYDAQRDVSWSVPSNYFYPYPRSGYFNINGDEFDLMDGVFGLALGPLRTDGDKTLYFHSLASMHESWVSTKLLRNQSLFTDGVNSVPREFFVSKERRSSQTAASAMSDDGVLFFNLLNQNSVSCWNSALTYSPQNLNVLDQDKRFQFASGMKIIKTRGGSEFLALTSRFQRIMVGKLDPREVNFRVWRAPVDTLVKGSSCEVRPSSGSREVRFPGYNSYTSATSSGTWGSG